jgi:probable HAF family extracellular repeat protein
MRIEDLGLPEGVTGVIPVDINDDRLVVVTGLTDQSASVFLYEGGAFRQIGGDDARSVQASAINGDGLVSGWIENDDGTTRALMVGEDNLVEMPGESASSRALSVNSEGILAGEAIINAGDAAASPVYWTDTTVEQLPSSGSGSWGAVTDSNTIGQMAGWSAIDVDGAERHATLWINDEATDLGTLGGMLSEARAINEIGQIVGVSTTAADQSGFDSDGSSPFLWQDGEMRNLGLGEGHGWGEVNDINDTGLIVGTVSNLSVADPATATSAVIWSSTALLDLNAISAGEGELHLAEAVAVNNFGQILCLAYDPEGNPHVVVLSVVGN